MPALEDQEFAHPLDLVQGFERQQEQPFLDECKFDIYKAGTINSRISNDKVRSARDELTTALSRVEPDAIAVGGDC